MMGRRSAPWLLLGALGVSGCATIGHAPAKTTETPIKTKRRNVPTKQAAGDVEQDGTRIRVAATRLCEVQETVVVRHHEVRERTNQSSGADILAGVAGGGLALSGALVYSDARRVYPKDTTSRTYNDVGPSGARGIGVGLIGAGAVLLAISAVDAIRASGSDESVSDRPREPEVRETGVACGIPYAGATVGLRRSGRELAVGVTDDRGRLDSDLVDQLPRGLLAGGDVQALTVTVEGQAVGEVDPAPFVAAAARRAWGRVDLRACEAATEMRECNAALAYENDFPVTAEAAEVRRVVKRSRARIADAERIAAQARAAKEAELAKQEAKDAAAATLRAKQQQQRAQAGAACRGACSSGCKGNASCTAQCIAAKCQ